MHRHQLELAVAEGAILHPELVEHLTGVLEPADFADPRLATLYFAALAASDGTAGSRYRAAHQTILERGWPIDLFFGPFRDTANVAPLAAVLAQEAEWWRERARTIARIEDLDRRRPLQAAEELGRVLA